jgi:hypothetical protein
MLPQKNMTKHLSRLTNESTWEEWIIGYNSRNVSLSQRPCINLSCTDYRISNCLEKITLNGYNFLTLISLENNQLSIIRKTQFTKKFRTNHKSQWVVRWEKQQLKEIYCIYVIDRKRANCQLTVKDVDKTRHKRIIFCLATGCPIVNTWAHIIQRW